jgi:hypothetical protein
MIVSQPETVIWGDPLEPLSPQERIEEIAADEDRDDQPEHITAAHIRSIPEIRANRAAKATRAMSTATKSMLIDWPRSHEDHVQKRGQVIQKL